MPAGLPGSTLAQNQGNPSAGNQVFMDALSGPKGSLLDAKRANYTSGGAFVADALNISTGAMSTGIGFGLNVGPIGISVNTRPATAPQAISDAGFNDDAGEVGPGIDSTRLYIGGGKGTLTNGVYDPVPWTAGFAPCGAGAGASRDGGTAGRGFAHKMVTAVGSVAVGVAIEAGWINRTNRTMVATESAFGSALAEQVALA